MLKWAGMEEYPRNVMDLERQFSTEEACKAYLFRLRWSDGFSWPDGFRNSTKIMTSNASDSITTKITKHHEGNFKKPSCSFVPFVVKWGSCFCTVSYCDLTGYTHVRQVQRQQTADEHLLPHVHQVASLLKRWLLGTHQGAIVMLIWNTIWMNSRFVLTAARRSHAESCFTDSSNKPSRSIP